MTVHLQSITFDCADPPAQAEFWSAVTGYTVTRSSPYFCELVGDGTVGPRFMFIKVPEAKTAKNRTHVDLGAEDLTAETQRLVALGATVVGEYDEWGLQWVTFRDPEGNEFCLGRHPRSEA
ncbi:MAG: VOC family protein [Actinomycetota bacterium]|nr:VOC family protein [Actinomycetota bacterium]